jgi:threonylcarbamoyladenosine tRNA methylthiotransferase MtaB
MKKVFFYTLGCRVNKYDTESLRTAFQALGFESAADIEDADVCIVNTCSVTAESDRKCRNQIRRLHRRNPRAFMVAAGCYAQGDPEKLQAMPEVDLVVGARHRESLPLEVLESLGLQCPSESVAMPELLAVFAERTRAFVKIEDGCNQMCTYCKIPFYRGRAHSRRSSRILEEIQGLSDKGFHEVVLCGIQLGAFGLDTGESLPELLEKVNDIPGIHRFRLSSIEPDDVTPELIDTVVSLPKCAPHMHIPLQSGDDGILKKMRRRYTMEDFHRLIGSFRDRNPHFAISTDILIGFPGEDEPAFQNSLRAIEDVQFCRLHIFRYSPRPGTAAVRLPGRIKPEVMDRRRQDIAVVGDKVVDQVRARQIGRTLHVLLEEPGSVPGSMVGFSGNYLRVEVQPVSPDQDPLDAFEGSIVPVRITGMQPEVLTGSIL